MEGDPAEAGLPVPGETVRQTMKRKTRRRLRKQVDTARLLECITDAEQKTSGEIRICISRFFWGSIYRTAERAFADMGMTQTRQRNGVLFFVVPSRRKFVVLGDCGIHARVGKKFWAQISDVVTDFFRQGKYTEGLEAGVQTVGNSLAEYFPFDPETDSNELPDEIRFR